MKKLGPAPLLLIITAIFLVGTSCRQSTNTNTDTDPVNTNQATANTNQATADGCEYYGTDYSVGDSFTNFDDECNVCTCDAVSEISCTDLDCDTTALRDDEEFFEYSDDYSTVTGYANKSGAVVDLSDKSNFQASQEWIMTSDGYINVPENNKDYLYYSIYDTELPSFDVVSKIIKYDPDQDNTEVKLQFSSNEADYLDSYYLKLCGVDQDKNYLIFTKKPVSFMGENESVFCYSCWLDEDLYYTDLNSGSQEMQAYSEVPDWKKTREQKETDECDDWDYLEE